MLTYIRRFGFFLLTNFAILTLLSLVVGVCEYFSPGITGSLGGTQNLFFFAFLYGIGGSFVSLWISRWMAKQSYGIQILDPTRLHEAHPKLQSVYKTVEQIARSHSITVPEVGYYESVDPNAFATGATKNSSLVAVSTGLLNAMDEKEIEGVVGHEMAHIINGDMVTLTLIQGVMNAFVIIISALLARVITSFLERDRENSLSHLIYNMVYTLLQMVFGFLAMFVIMWFSRQREYRADLGGAQFTSKSRMISGLKKLQALSKLPPSRPIGKNMSAFMITESKDSFFSTHPSLENRIKSLEENYQLA